MAELTAKTALAKLKPFEEAVATARAVLEAADQAETAAATATGRIQDAERQITQAALKVAQAEAQAEAAIREAERKAQASEQALKDRLGQTKRTLEGQLANLSDEIAAERGRLEQVTQARQQADRDLAAVRQDAKALEGIRHSLQQAEAERTRLEGELADLARRTDAKQAAYERITADIAALRA